MEQFENIDWEQFSPTPNDAAELKKIQKNIRKRSWITVLTSVLLVTVLIVIAVYVGVPALESRYWDPTVSTYVEDNTDLELALVTYTELFGHGQHLMDVDITKTGFAAYQVEASFTEWETMSRLAKTSQRSASLVKGKLNLPSSFLPDDSNGFFFRPSDQNSIIQLETDHAIEKLESLPEYVHVLASVSFPEYLTMEDYVMLTQQAMRDTNYIWAVLKTRDDSEKKTPFCGFLLYHYFEYYNAFQWQSSDYPYLFPDINDAFAPSSMEQHVLSIFRFSADQVAQGTGILPEGEDSSFYRTTLNYLEENGIQIYGSYVIATPDTLLNMIDNGTVRCVSLVDVWLDY